MTLSLRDAAPSDEAILLEWANDPAVRQASFDSSPIAAETHARWYGAKLQSPDTAFFIAEQDGRPVGYARVDRWGPDTGEIAVSVEAAARGQGLGTRLIALAARRGAEYLGASRVVARVRSENEASVRAFVSAGFVRLQGGEDVTLVWPGGPLVPHSRPFVGEREAAGGRGRRALARAGRRADRRRDRGASGAR